MLGHGWEFQWERVNRRLKDVQAVYTGAPGGTDIALDKALSLFEVVHHLRDWLRNDPNIDVPEAAVEELIKGSLALRLCGDLANGSKHLALERRPWTGDKSTAITRNDVRVLVGTETSAHRFYIASSGKEHDVLEIAEQAVEEWSRFLSERHLIGAAHQQSGHDQ
ncbi:hypothetical protein ABTZ58_33535 [Streptomyces sp. NPDC094143]|uniref:hypothetical protein n=1 Tax=Streptomyces sp. NPDC094143 TaxID=3155310 RepID=UPI003329079B